MKHFTELYLQLDGTTRSTVRQQALVHYFENADPRDKLWLIALFTGKRPKRTVSTSQLKDWVMEKTGIPPWLFEQSYHVVGDLAETIALLIPAPESVQTEKSLAQYIREIQALRTADEEEKKAYIYAQWEELTKDQLFIFNKLITGGFRLGVSQKSIVKALAMHLDRDENIIAHRLMGNWHPSETNFYNLLITEKVDDDYSRPYPFYLAYPLEEGPTNLGKEQDWLVERKWDGIRGQVIVRNDTHFVWSRGEELVTDRYPEFGGFTALPNGTVIDGEIMAFKDEPLPFSALQKRIGRKRITAKLMEEVPAVLIAYDLLEWKGEDIRNQPCAVRRQYLEALVNKFALDCMRLSPLVNFVQWDDLNEEREVARLHKSEGLMLKKRSSTYGVGRKRGDWWKWKMEPLVIDAVLLYAMRGHGRRANLYTDYTFAVWNGNELVPFTKAYSGLTDKEITEVDRFVKKNTIERFGPVRSVSPELVFEIAFEGIATSSRHKSGVALRFPRMNRWRKDKPAKEANTLEDLKDLLKIYGN